MFKFELEPVLSLKQKIEDNKKRELGFLQQQKEVLILEEQKLQDEKRTLLKEAKVQGRSSVDVRYFKFFNQYDAYMKKTIEMKQQEIKKKEVQVDEKRSELISAVKERKILENLKERKKEIFYEEEKREEQHKLDEVVTYQFGTKTKE